MERKARPVGGPGFDLQQWMSSRREQVDRTLDRLLTPPESSLSALYEAMRYSVFAGGKRLRPILSLAACEASGGDASLALPVAAALEMIHTYSLVHDDLPAMDDDSLRRGKPTTHVVYGEAIAILAGDALLTLAFEILAREPEGEALAGRRSEASALIARAAGAAGMAGGQADDLEAAGAAAHTSDRESAEARLLSIHRRKTGALITASVVSGAVLAGAGETDRMRLRIYGEALGLCFQIVDDILDVESTTTRLGKSAGKDARDRKLTFPAIVGLEESRRRAGDLARRAQREAEALGPRASVLVEIAAFVLSRDH